MEFGLLNLDVIWVSLTFNGHILDLGLACLVMILKNIFSFLNT